MAADARTELAPPSETPVHAPLVCGPRTGDSTTALPTELAVDQTVRLQVFYAVGVALWAINLVMDAGLAPNGDRGPYRLIIEVSAGALAAATASFMRFSRVSPRAKVDLGAALIVPHAMALALLNSWTVQPTTMRPLSGVTVLILFFAMLAPARPSRIFAASVVAAAMDPLGVWIAHLRGLPVPSPLATLAMFYPNFACAVLAVAPAHLLYGLGRRLQEARALGSYQLVERLGEGGMGEVWVARHRLLARSAAIKLVRPDRLGQSGSADAARTLDRFEREAQATAALTSPHTIRLFDFGLSREGTFYYVMELLDGCDLESLVRDFGPLPAGRAMYLLQQVCRSLAEAHAKGLVHRDIKPANVYVCRMGLEFDFVKVLDFGLVKYEASGPATPTLTGQPMAMGTPAYMAPEVILGGTDVDRRVDVYALGCVAYYLLTGERVFDALTDMRLLVKHLHEEPVPPSRRVEQPVPADLDDLVMACLRKDPSQRPADAAELLRRLSACDPRTWDQGSAQSWWERHMPNQTDLGPLAVGLGQNAIAASAAVCRV
jgi:eukaryotic-like serine/threonine-protein kinase